MEENVVTTEEVRDEEKHDPHTFIKTTRVVSPSIEEEPQHIYETKKVLFRASHIIWYIVGIIEVLLGFRILLKLIGANPVSAFTQIIYSLSDPFTLPFSGIVRTTVSGYSVMEWSSLIAMAVYAIVAWGIIEFFQVVKPIGKKEIKHAI